MKKNLLRSFTFPFIVFLICLPFIFLIPLCFGASYIYPDILPQGWTMKYLCYVFFESPHTMQACINTFVIGFFTSLLTIVIAIPVSKAISLYEFKGKWIIKALVLVPLIVPSVTLTSGMQMIMIKLHLTATMLGIILAHTMFALPYAIYIFINVFEIMRDRHEQSAKNLGANNIQTFWFITIPLLMPAILSAFMISFTISLGQYISTFMIGGGKFITLPILFVPYIQSGQIQVASVYSLIFVICSLLMLVLTEQIIKKRYRLLGLSYA